MTNDQVQLKTESQSQINYGGRTYNFTGSQTDAQPVRAEFETYDEAKNYILEHGPITVPKRFLWGTTFSTQRIEAIAARLIYRDTSPWKGVLSEHQRALLLRTFGLNLVSKGGKHIPSGGRKFFKFPPPLNTVRALEKLWDSEYETSVRLREVREALCWVRGRRSKLKEMVGERIYREYQDQVYYWHERLRLIVTSEYLLINQIAFPDQTLNTFLETDFLALPHIVWSNRIKALGVNFLPDWLIRERVRSATALLDKRSDCGDASHLEGSLKKFCTSWRLKFR